MDNSASIEATISSLASKGMGGGTVASLFGWVTSNNMLTLFGVVTTLLGFVVNFIFKYREDRRRQELHAFNLAALNGDKDRP